MRTSTLPIILCIAVLALLLPGCAPLRFADLAGRWELDQRHSDVVPTAMSKGVEVADTAMAVPVALMLEQEGDSATVLMRDSHAGIHVANYVEDAHGQLVAQPGNPGNYVIMARKHRMVLTDAEGHRLVFIRKAGQ